MLPLNVECPVLWYIMSIVDTELWNLELNKRSAKWLFNRSTTRWAIYIADVDFWKSCSSLFTLNEEYCSAFVMDALYGTCSDGGWCVIAVKCSSQRKYCFLLCSNNSFFVSIFFLFLFDGHTLCQPVLCFQGIKAHGSASLSSRRLLSECLCSPGRGCLVVVSHDVLC